MEEPWNEAEEERLKALGVNSARHTREDLILLRDHFKAGGGITKVTDHGEPVTKSKDFARKYRRLVNERKMDWLSSGERTPESKTGREGQKIADDPVMEKHFERLRAPLLDLKEVLPLPIHDRDIGTWYVRPNEESWPVTKGRAFREGDSVVDVRLDAEAASEAEFEYLNQHLPDDPIWNVIDDWKKSMAKDLSARFALLRKVVNHIKSPEDNGGLGMPVEENLERTTQPCAIGIYFAFIVYDQILTGEMNLNHKFFARDRVRLIPPDIMEISGLELVKSSDELDRERALDFMFEGWREVDWDLEVDALAEAYTAAELQSNELKRHVNRLRLTPGFPSGSGCELCRGVR